MRVGGGGGGHMSGRKMIKATLVSGLGRGQGWHLQVYVKGPMCEHVPFIIYENISVVRNFIKLLMV